MGDDNGSIMAIDRRGEQKIVRRQNSWQWSSSCCYYEVVMVLVLRLKRWRQWQMKCWREVVTLVVVLQNYENIIMIVGFVTSSDGSKWRASYTSKSLNFREKNQIFQFLLRRAFAHPFCFSHFGEFLPKRQKKNTAHTYIGKV